MKTYLPAFILVLALPVFGMGAGGGGGRAACPNEPENSEAGLKYLTGGRSIRDLAFGSEQTCLESHGLLANGALRTDARINGTALDRFYTSCVYGRTSQFAAIRELNAAVSLKGRDLLVDGLFQEIAHRSHAQLQCRQNTLSLFESSPAKRADTTARAQSQFNSVLADVKALIQEKANARRTSNQDVFGRMDCTGVAWLFCRDVANEETRNSEASVEARIAAKLSLVPFGYEPSIAAALLTMASSGQFDANKFAAAMSQAKAAYKREDSYWDDKRTPAGRGHERFCITREFKEQVASGDWSASDQVLSDMSTNRLNNGQKTAVQCYLRSHYKDAPNNATEVRHGVIAGVTGAAIGLSAMATDGGSLVAATALGLDAVLFADQLNKAIKACTASNIVVATTGAMTCDPEKNFQRESEQTERGSCGAEAAWAAVAAIPVFGVGVKAVVRGLRGADAVADAADAARAADPANDIIVTARVSRRERLNRFFDNETVTRNLNLGDNERRVAMAALCPDRKKSCIDALMDSHNLDKLSSLTPGTREVASKLERAIDRLKRAGLSSSEATRVAKDCIRSGLCGSAAEDGRFISYVDATRGQRLTGEVVGRRGDGLLVRDGSGVTRLLSASELETVKTSALSRIVNERTGEAATDGFRMAYSRGELGRGQNMFISFVDTSGRRLPGKILRTNADGGLEVMLADGTTKALTKEDLLNVRFSGTAVDTFRAPAGAGSGVANLFRGQPSHTVGAADEYLSPRAIRLADGSETRFAVRSDPSFREAAVATGKISEFAPGASVRLPAGHYTYLITEDGRLVVGKVDDSFELGVKHQNLANGRPVVSAGELFSDGRGGFEFDLESGTYSRTLEGVLGVPKRELQRRTEGALNQFFGREGALSERIAARGVPPTLDTIRRACNNPAFLAAAVMVRGGPILNRNACCQAVGIGCH